MENNQAPQLDPKVVELLIKAMQNAEHDYEELVNTLTAHKTSYNLDGFVQLAKSLGLNPADPMVKPKMDELLAAIGDRLKDLQDSKRFVKLATEDALFITYAMMYSRAQESTNPDDAESKRLEDELEKEKEAGEKATKELGDWQDALTALVVMVLGPYVPASLDLLKPLDNEKLIDRLLRYVSMGKGKAKLVLQLLRRHLSSYSTQDLTEFEQLIAQNPTDKLVQAKRAELRTAIGDTEQDIADTRQMLQALTDAGALLGCTFSIKEKSEDSGLTEEELAQLKAALDDATMEVTKEEGLVSDWQQYAMALVLMICGPYIDEAVNTLLGEVTSSDNK